MGLSRGMHLRLGTELLAELRSFGDSNGLGLSPATRLLLARALRAERGGAITTSDDLTALGALVAAEHAVLMVASILPEGEQRMRSLAERASQAAEERLALLRETEASR